MCLEASDITLISVGPSSTASTCRDGHALRLFCLFVCFEELIYLVTFLIVTLNNWMMQLKEVFVSAHSLRLQSVCHGRKAWQRCEVIGHIAYMYSEET